MLLRTDRHLLFSTSNLEPLPRPKEFLSSLMRLDAVLVLLVRCGLMSTGTYLIEMEVPLILLPSEDVLELVDFTHPRATLEMLPLLCLTKTLTWLMFSTTELCGNLSKTTTYWTGFRTLLLSSRLNSETSRETLELSRMSEETVLSLVLMLSLLVMLTLFNPGCKRVEFIPLESVNLLSVSVLLSLLDLLMPLIFANPSVTTTLTMPDRKSVV